MTAHYVYRCYGDDGALVYVGATKDPVARMATHHASAFWARYVARVKVTVHPAKETALAVERGAIRNESPRFNNLGRWATRGTWAQKQYDDFIHTLVATSATDYNRSRLDTLFVDYARLFGSPHPQAEPLRARRADTDSKRARSTVIYEAKCVANELRSKAEYAEIYAEHLESCEPCVLANAGDYCDNCVEMVEDVV